MTNIEKAILELSYSLGEISSLSISDELSINNLSNSITRTINSLSQIYYEEQNNLYQSQIADEIYEQFRR